MSEANTAAPAQAAQSNPAESVAQDPNLEQKEGQQAGSPEVKKEEAAKTEEKKRIKQLTYKANGKEYSEDLPFEIDENPEAVAYLTKQLSLAKAAQEALHETTNTKKQVKAFIDYLGKDTAKALTEMGINVKDLAAAVIEEELRAAQMTPEQKELEELRSQKKQIEEEKQRMKEEKEASERSAREQAEYVRIENEIADAIGKTHLPKEPATVKRVAEYLKLANLRGKELSAGEAMELVEQDIRSEMKSIVDKLDDDMFEDFVGKERLGRQRKKNITKAKEIPLTPATAKSNTVEVKKEAKKEEKTETKKQAKDFFGFKL